MIFMERDIQFTYRDRTTSSGTIDIPNYCPHCGSIMMPHIIYAYSKNESWTSEPDIALLLQCTAETCNKFFALEYSQGLYGSPVEYSYNPPIDDDLPKEIKKISPSFEEIYYQSLIAEQSGLDKIAGVGFRKSIEFLIKDYLINVKGEPENDVKSEWLKPSIDRINFQPLKDLTTAADWIGNDETHYVKKLVGKDVQDMKGFIRAAILFISADYQAADAKQMLEKSKS